MSEVFDETIDKEMYDESKKISKMIMEHYRYYIYPNIAFEDYNFTGVYLNNYGKIATKTSTGTEFYLIQPAPKFIYEVLSLGKHKRDDEQDQVYTNFISFFYHLKIWYEKTFAIKYIELKNVEETYRLVNLPKILSKSNDIDESSEQKGNDSSTKTVKLSKLVKQKTKQ